MPLSYSQRRKQVERRVDRLQKTFANNPYRPGLLAKRLRKPITPSTQFAGLKRLRYIGRPITEKLTDSLDLVRTKGKLSFSPLGRITHYSYFGLSASWEKMPTKKQDQFAKLVIQGLMERRRNSSIPLAGIKRRFAPGKTTLRGLVEGHMNDVMHQMDLLTVRMTNAYSDQDMRRSKRLGNYVDALTDIGNGIESGKYRP